MHFLHGREKSYVERLKNKDEKNLIVKHLLLGNNVQPLLLQNHILYPEKEYCAMLIYMLEDTEWESLSDYYQWQSSICETISYSFRDICQCSWLEMDFHRMLFLMTTQAKEQPQGQELFSQITQSLQRMMETVFSGRVLIYVTYSNEQEDLLPLYRKMDGHLRTRLCLSNTGSADGNIYIIEPQKNTQRIEPAVGQHVGSALG